jgi:sugar lactone lactonase YvrE
LALHGCGDDTGSKPGTADAGIVNAVDSSAVADVATGIDATSAIDTARTATNFIAMPQGAPETTLWDAAHSLLYIIDNTGNAIWKWTDAGGLVPFVSCPLPAGETSLPANVTLGQAALLADGTLVVARFGQPGGGDGGIAYVRKDGTAGLVPNLDPTIRRLGLVAGPDGTLYGSTFGGSGNNIIGTVTTVDLQAGETTIADGFGKIVGLVIADGRFYVSDQTAGKIFYAPAAALPPHAAAWTALATLVKPDQICAGPNGSLFTGQFQGAPGSTDPIAIRQISADGVVSIFKQDPEVSKPSGVSYDPVGRRLFAADSGNVANIGVRIFSVP